ncbi:SpoIID/LytB domain-containing protein [Alicyclobacillus vulcanalis]|uniref:Stage II sporulation protein D n=1 Tax=Alicyclobacillus vulcanalis TaxID=252246 RepID=A0A1N7LEY1_9BACL|nr:SpoIID/LytB domain-containing protein [Alicyclobacillus vulcanalis]SIS72382.1 stage II sporulation protein D [Alicyclobacillus vulcanalis]
MSQPSAVRKVLQLAVRFALVFAAMVMLPVGVAKAIQRSPMPDVSAWVAARDARIQLRVFDEETGAVNTMPLNAYILGVLLANCSPSAPLSSLEAASVAVRTYAIRAMLHPSPEAQKEHADVTDNPSLDLSMETEHELQLSIGAAAALSFISRAQTAIEATDHQILTYRGQPILAFLCTISTGRTRSGEEALGYPIPYLQSLPCPADLSSPDRVSTVTYTLGAFNQALSAHLTNFSSLRVTRTHDGFVQSVKAGETSWSGPAFAARLGLASDDFTFTVRGDELVFTCYGRGPDLGMSLHQADALAAGGMSYKAILSHFYPGARLEDLQSQLQRMVTFGN